MADMEGIFYLYLQNYFLLNKFNYKYEKLKINTK